MVVKQTEYSNTSRGRDFTAFIDSWGTFLHVHQDIELKQERMTQETHQLTSFIFKYLLLQILHVTARSELRFNPNPQTFICPRYRAPERSCALESVNVVK